MKKIAFILALVMIFSSALWGCDMAETDTTGQAADSMEDTENTDEIHTNETGEKLQQDADTKTCVTFENYDSIISTYRKIIEICPRYEEIETDDVFTFLDEEARSTYSSVYIATFCLYPRNTRGIDGNCYDRFGYTIKDLNQDGVNELILRLDNRETIALFTMIDEKPVLLDYYWNRKNCWIDPEGYLHVGGSSGADYSSLEIYSISDQTGNLILLDEGGTDGYDEATSSTRYYKLVNNEKIYITQEEYSSWKQNLPYSKFEETANISEYLPFVTAFDENHPAPEPYVRQADG